MNIFKILPFGVLAIMSASCSKSSEGIPEGSAEVSITLTADDTHFERSKAPGESELPDIGDFTVDIFKTGNGKRTRLYRDTYANSTDTKIRLNAGSYKMLASHGDSLAAGFNAAYFAAEVPFSISADQRKVNISGTARLANVKAAVEFGDDLKNDYVRYCASLSSDKKGATDTLGFASTETRAGYIAAGNLTFILYAAEDGAKMKYYKAPAIKANPNDFITFTVNTTALTGKISVSIKIDNSVETTEKEIVIDATDVATGTPSITLGSKLAAGTVEFYEGDELGGDDNRAVLVDINSPAGFSHAWLDVTSSYLAAKGVPSRVDLSDISASVKKVFSDIGIQILETGENDRFAYIDFAGMSDKLAYESTPFEGTFKLTVEDKNGSTATSDSFSLKMLKNEATIAASTGNAFARSFRGLQVNVKTGKAEKFTLQYRTAGGTWTDVPAGTVSGSTISYGNITGLTPGTQYELRAIYNGNTANSTDVVTLTTEDAAQVDNAGFEDWSTETISISVVWSSSRTLDWYLPYRSSATDKWWAVTSKKSMPTNILATTKTSVKSFPTVAFSPESTEGTRSAHIYTVNIGTLNTDLVASGTSYAGELFIGTADDSGNHASDGHSFASRPDRFTFKYKYSSYNSETFYVKIEFKDASGNSISSKELTGSGASDWTAFNVDLDWSDISKKAASIYISFKSASTGSPKVDANSTLEVAGNYEQKGHFGSSLYIDDLQLIYE